MNNLIAYEKHKNFKMGILELKNRCIKMGRSLQSGSDNQYCQYSIVQYECGEDAAGICKNILNVSGLHKHHAYRALCMLFWRYIVILHLLPDMTARIFSVIFYRILKEQESS